MLEKTGLWSQSSPPLDFAKLKWKGRLSLEAYLGIAKEEERIAGEFCNMFELMEKLSILHREEKEVWHDILIQQIRDSDRFLLDSFKVLNQMLSKGRD